jgi:predicted ATPase
MRLSHLRVRGFRSYPDSTSVDLSLGLTCVMGPNNSGKSNLIRALELAMAADGEIDPSRDLPQIAGAPSARSVRVELTFQTDARPDDRFSSPERRLLQATLAYERAAYERHTGSRLLPRSSNAGRGRVVHIVHFVVRRKGTETRRYDFLGVPGLSRVSPTSRNSPYPDPGSPEHVKAFREMSDLIRFVSVRSGQSLESFLEGPFKEVLEGVIQDHLEVELDEARRARQGYADHLSTQLLGPLSGKIADITSKMFAGMSTATLVPSLPTLTQTLSSMGVRLGDSMTSDLAFKGTGVRAGVLAAILGYLVEQSSRSLVFAIEEPESFLHPAAQEDLRDSLVDLATRPDTTVVITSHSPFMAPRGSEGSLVEVIKTPNGASRIRSESGIAPGGGLFRDPGLARVLEDARSLDRDARIVVVTEGATDGEYMALAAQRAGRPELTADIQFIPAEGASRLPALAVLTAQATERPVIALVDSDEEGKRAARALDGFKPQPNRITIKIGSLRVIGPGRIVAEDLWPSALRERMERELLPMGKAYYKRHAVAWLEQHATPDDCGDWVSSLELIRKTAGSALPG